MQVFAGLPSRQPHERVRLLLADGDARRRSSLAARVLETLETLVVLEAEDGPEAVQVGLQQRPHIAILDIDMPKLGGIEVALALRAFEPEMRVAVQTAEPQAHAGQAREHRLPLFDESEPERALTWLEVQLQSRVRGRVGPTPRQKQALECSSCRYGIVCSRLPARCPMCQTEGAWIHAPWRPFRGVSAPIG